MELETIYIYDKLVSFDCADYATRTRSILFYFIFFKPSESEFNKSLNELAITSIHRVSIKQLLIYIEVEEW